MSKHTPGPWVAQIDKHIKRGRKPLPRMALVMVGGGQAIDCTYSGVDFEESAANARLIAAAPEMLEALTKIKAALMIDAREPDTSGDVTEYRIDGNTMYHALNAARAVISKAEGCEP